ncbi:MAG: acetylglutamate kinase [Candidatus Thermofonsia Clade 1 bacterium]|uniref:Putative [LysW]-aminoadipate kinase n=1 Tax=Candidatus Thermofonsia Clade 1 bacterium TaxID=2364210 RepID=A0A2M8PG92_9CHLR|nr:MAG: acetylglutamate kinase [Candidatus Thermofonsia Clade 1 bacterium]RMF52844.1 MAG: [LysW]-aminoadipate kinase [Chloroflexota bacterium]
MIVVKVGGGAGVDVDSVCADLAVLAHTGKRLVLVHGTSAAVDRLSERVGVPRRTLQSPSGHVSRYTDPETLELYVMAANGQVNTTLTAKLQALGVNALGLSGVDGRLMAAQRKDAVRVIDPSNGRQRIVRDDFTGKIERINAELLQLLLANGYLPVIAPLAISQACEPLNVDGDRAAAMIATALRAETLVILTNVPGLLARFPDESSLVRHVPRAHLERALELAGGRMKKKILAAQEALEGGVQRILLADSRRPQPLQTALAGEGTAITHD